MKKRFPLEPLVSKKKDDVERRARELADAERQALREKETHKKARERRENAAEHARSEALSERSRLEQGEGKVQDLTRGELFRVREATRIDALRQAEEKAGRASEAAERETLLRRSALGGARADARSLERHKERWEKAREHRASSAEEEQAQDFHAVLRRRKKD
jgi:cortactin